MKRKINSRLIGIALIAILVTLLGVTSIYYYLFENQVRKDLHVLAETLVDSGVFEKSRLENIVFESKDVRVTWVDTDGSVIYDSWTDAEKLGNHMERPEIQDAFKTGYGDSIRTSDTMQVNTYYYALKMEDGTVVRVARNASSGMSIFLNAMPVVAVIVILVTFACIVFADYLTKQLLKPIATIADKLDDTDGGGGVEVEYKELA